jgi:hypothetical protein
MSFGLGVEYLESKGSTFESKIIDFTSFLCIRLMVNGAYALLHFFMLVQYLLAGRF